MNALNERISSDDESISSESSNEEIYHKFVRIKFKRSEVIDSRYSEDRKIEDILRSGVEVEDKEYHLVLEIPDNVKQYIGDGKLVVEIEVDVQEEEDEEVFFKVKVQAPQREEEMGRRGESLQT